MPEQRRLAVIVVRNDMGTPMPNMADVQSLVLFSPSSVARYFRESAEDYFLLSPVDFFGPYDISLPPAPDSRYTAIDRARTAATNAGVDLGPYDGTIVFGFPGTGYDGGATAIGPGASAFLPATSDFTFFCHEIGHVLGFDHTYGIPTTGADWSNDGIDQLYPVYGDPYDLMSSATFGGASPTGSRPDADVPAAYPSWKSSPPHISRALLHYTKPAALDASGKVRHVYESGTNAINTLYPVGAGDADKAELIVYHPANEDDRGRGRVYVEYRQPFDFNWASRWDQGLATAAEAGARDRCGVIVHTVLDIPGTSSPAVWYSGRIVFPSPDSDADVDTPQGRAVVAVSNDFVQSSAPGYVRVRVSRNSLPSLTVLTADTDVVTVTSSVRKPHPGWEWAGDFTWERRETQRTTTYTPITTGIGGHSPIDAESSAVVSWFVGGTQIFGNASTIMATPTGGGAPVELACTLHPTTRVLTLTNRPSDGTFEVAITGRASDAAGVNPAFATTAYRVDGVSEGWGEDWDRFMDFWYRITHPIPIGDLVPHPDPGDPLARIARVQLERIRTAYAALEATSPEVAERLQPLMVDQERVLSQSAVR
jgi:hypothetical protein